MRSFRLMDQKNVMGVMTLRAPSLKFYLGIVNLQIVILMKNFWGDDPEPPENFYHKTLITLSSIS
jgi:hypothetical protein